MPNVNNFGLEETLVSVTLPSQVDLSGSQYRAVKNVAGFAVPITAITDKVYGILQNDPTILAPVGAKIGTRGTSRIELAGTVAAGDHMTISATGTGKVAAVGETIIGICAVGGTVGEWASINLDGHTVLAPA